MRCTDRPRPCASGRTARRWEWCAGSPRFVRGRPWTKPSIRPPSNAPAVIPPDVGRGDQVGAAARTSGRRTPTPPSTTCDRLGELVAGSAARGSTTRPLTRRPPRGAPREAPRAGEGRRRARGARPGRARPRRDGPRPSSVGIPGGRRQVAVGAPRRRARPRGRIRAAARAPRARSGESVERLRRRLHRRTDDDRRSISTRTRGSAGRYAPEPPRTIALPSAAVQKRKSTVSSAARGRRSRASSRRRRASGRRRSRRRGRRGRRRRGRTAPSRGGPTLPSPARAPRAPPRRGSGPWPGRPPSARPSPRRRRPTARGRGRGPAAAPRLRGSARARRRSPISSSGVRRSETPRAGANVPVARRPRGRRARRRCPPSCRRRPAPSRALPADAERDARRASRRARPCRGVRGGASLRPRDRGGRGRRRRALRTATRSAGTPAAASRGATHSASAETAPASADGLSRVDERLEVREHRAGSRREVREELAAPATPLTRASSSVSSVKRARTSRRTSTPIPGPVRHRHEAVRRLERAARRCPPRSSARRTRCRPASRSRAGVAIGDVVRPPDARLEHPAAPERDARRRGHLVDPERLAVPADAADLHVDDAARAEGDRRARVGRRADRLVEADRRRRASSRARACVDEVLVVERLLDVVEAERVERAGAVRMSRACRRRSRRPSAADRGNASRTAAHPVHVGARLDLQLDPPVPLRDVPRARSRPSPRPSARCRARPRPRSPSACRRGSARATSPPPSRRGRAAPSRAPPSPSGSRGPARRERSNSPGDGDLPPEDERKQERRRGRARRRADRLRRVERPLLGDALPQSGKALRTSARRGGTTSRSSRRTTSGTGTSAASRTGRRTAASMRMEGILTEDPPRGDPGVA